MGLFQAFFFLGEGGGFRDVRDEIMGFTIIALGCLGGLGVVSRLSGLGILCIYTLWGSGRRLRACNP